MRALYRASQRGVTIDLIVRDTCRLRPGLDGVSSTIKVVSVIGRFLEHARIYYFHNGGTRRVLPRLGGRDAAQPREARRGAGARSRTRACRPSCATSSTPSSRDQRGAWDMQPDGSYVQRTGLDAKHSQQQMIERTERRLKEATRLRRRKVQSTTVAPQALSRLVAAHSESHDGRPTCADLDLDLLPSVYLATSRRTSQSDRTRGPASRCGALARASSRAPAALAGGRSRRPCRGHARAGVLSRCRPASSFAHVNGTSRRRRARSDTSACTS